MSLCPVASAVLWDVVLKSGRVGTTWGAFKTPGAWAAPQSNELGISEVGFFTSVFKKKKRKETKTKLQADPRRSHGRRRPCCEHFLLYN